jgi:hypothetical protein
VREGRFGCVGLGDVAWGGSWGGGIGIADFGSVHGQRTRAVIATGTRPGGEIAYALATVDLPGNETFSGGWGGGDELAALAFVAATGTKNSRVLGIFADFTCGWEYPSLLLSNLVAHA